MRRAVLDHFVNGYVPATLNDRTLQRRCRRVVINEIECAACEGLQERPESEDGLGATDRGAAAELTLSRTWVCSGLLLSSVGWSTSGVMFSSGCAKASEQCQRSTASMQMCSAGCTRFLPTTCGSDRAL